MKKYLIKYNEILDMYQNGSFGSKHLSLDEILNEANEPNLISKMTVNEIFELENKSFGISKRMYSIIKQHKIEEIKKMQDLEKELSSFHLEKYCENGSITDAELAKDLKLEVCYCDSQEMPKDVEATLSQPTNSNFFGLIKIMKDSVSDFSYMHEIIHYFRDVGVGNKVKSTYTRKRQGKTDSPAEQEINYLAAAAIMPYIKISTLIEKFENVTFEDEKIFLEEFSKEYSQSYETVARRFVEVRKLMDYEEYLLHN